LLKGDNWPLVYRLYNTEVKTLKFIFFCSLESETTDRYNIQLTFKQTKKENEKEKSIK
jgi:hypothetical protein